MTTVVPEHMAVLVDIDVTCWVKVVANLQITGELPPGAKRFEILVLARCFVMEHTNPPVGCVRRISLPVRRPGPGRAGRRTRRARARRPPAARRWPRPPDRPGSGPPGRARGRERSRFDIAHRGPAPGAHSGPPAGRTS